MMILGDRPYSVSKEPDGIVKMVDHQIQFGGIGCDEPDVDMISGRIVKLTLRMEDITDRVISLSDEDVAHAKHRGALAKLTDEELRLLGLSEQAVEAKLMSGISPAPVLSKISQDQITFDEWFNGLFTAPVKEPNQS